MALSNTATPRYYGAFREKVLRGEIPVNREVSMEMNRIDNLIRDPNIYYDDQAVEGYVKYCEWELTLTDGTDLHLLDTFKVWAEQVFGWYYFIESRVYQPAPSDSELTFEFKDGEQQAQAKMAGGFITKRIKKRLTTKQYLIVARGAAKSMYAYTIQSFFLNCDVTTTHQITTAPTMKQAEEVMSPFRTAIVRARGPLFKFLTEGSVRNTTGPEAMRQKLASTKKGIENFLTGSILEIRPMTINKLQGLRPKVSTIDEWLSGDIREDVIGAIEQGASKAQGSDGVEDYLIIAISSEGTVRNGSGDTIKMELQKVLKGEYEAPHISIWHYKLDDVAEVADPAMWPKANPNIGITVTYDVYHKDVERAEKAPAARNDILAKRFGLPMEGYTYFFTYEETIPNRPIDCTGMVCALGADLSQGDDFCAFTFLFPIAEDTFAVKTRSYIAERTLMKLPGAMRQKYEEFRREGSLHIMDGSLLDMNLVYDDLDEFIQASQYDVRALGYDPYNAKEFLARWEMDNGSFAIEKVIQGAKTESVPLGEMKTLAELHVEYPGAKGVIFDQALMSFAMGNAVTLEDTNGNRKLQKRRAEEKIDNVSAWMDAHVAFKIHKEQFV
jgi:phage terminase large subunit-like protein